MTLLLASATAMTLGLVTACGRGTPTGDATAHAPPTAAQTSPAPTAPGLVVALAEDGSREGRAQDIARAEAWLADVAADAGVEVVYFHDVWDGTDLLSPFSPTLEALRRRLPGDGLASLCPLTTPLPGASDATGAVIAIDLEDFVAAPDLHGAVQLHDRVERLVGSLRRTVENHVAVGDASTSIELEPGVADSPTVDFPSDWLAASAADVARVTCLRVERTEEVLRTCRYSGGVEIQTLRLEAIADIYDARSAALLTTVIVPGPDDDAECTLSLSISDELADQAREGPLRFDGPLPEPASILAELSPVLGPPD